MHRLQRLYQRRADSQIYRHIQKQQGRGQKIHNRLQIRRKRERPEVSDDRRRSEYHRSCVVRSCRQLKEGAPHEEVQSKTGKHSRLCQNARSLGGILGRDLRGNRHDVSDVNEISGKAGLDLQARGGPAEGEHAQDQSAADRTALSEAAAHRGKDEGGLFEVWKERT